MEMTLFKAQRAARLIEQVLGIRVPGRRYSKRVIKERAKISESYDKLKKANYSFTTASELARRIWLTDFLLTL